MPTGLVLGESLLTGLLIALYGVAFWSAGVLVAAYLWKRWRGDGPPGSGDPN